MSIVNDNMSDTPETDAQGWGDGLHPWVATDFARKLERERDEARKIFIVWPTATLLKLRRERDEAREQVKELIYIAERAIDLAEIDFENDKFGVVSELRSDLEKIKEGAK
jgi:hypothetical protein